MLPPDLKAAIFRMSQLPKTEHVTERFSHKRDRSDYWKERYANVMKPRKSGMSQAQWRRRIGKLGKARTQKSAPLVLKGTPRGRVKRKR